MGQGTTSKGPVTAAGYVESSDPLAIPFPAVKAYNTLSGCCSGRVGVLRMIDYKVRLDVYNGPLDLLLYLIRRNEIDIYDIPIATVTE